MYSEIHVKEIAMQVHTMIPLPGFAALLSVSNQNDRSSQSRPKPIPKGGVFLETGDIIETRAAGCPIIVAGAHKYGYLIVAKLQHGAIDDIIGKLQQRGVSINEIVMIMPIATSEEADRFIEWARESFICKAYAVKPDHIDGIDLARETLIKVERRA